MTNIIFLGFGNVGYHLCNALYKHKHITVIQIYNRNKIVLDPELNHIPVTTKLSELKNADIYFIALPDDAIKSFSKDLPFQNKLVVHTSGSVEMNELSAINRKGVFYPLQTFSKKRTVNFKEVPICIEAESSSDLRKLKEIGEILSEKIIEIDSNKRAQLHLAAVYANNFVNYMYTISSAILAENNLSFDLLKPLISETARKIETLSAKEVQTGPARRNDQKTIEKHLHLLKDSRYKELYEQITIAIQTSYGKKL